MLSRLAQAKHRVVVWLRSMLPVIVTLIFATPAGAMLGYSARATPDAEGGPTIVDALTSPGQTFEKTPSGWIKRPKTRQEVERFCSNACAFGWDPLPAGRGGIALPR